MKEISCEDIRGMNEEDLVVYFGPQEDLAQNGQGEVVLHSAIDEIYQYSEVSERARYFWNNDIQCKREMGLDLDFEHIGLFNGEKLTPVFYESEEGGDWPTLKQLSYQIVIRSLQAAPRWDQKAYNAIATHQINALFLFVHGDESSLHAGSDDWRVQLSYGINEELRNKNNSNLISIVQPYEIKAEKGAL